MVGVFSVSLGIVLGYAGHPLLMLFGAGLAAVMGFVPGAAAMAFKGLYLERSEAGVFVGQIAFFSDLMLLVGVIGYLIGDRSCPLRDLVVRAWLYRK